MSRKFDDDLLATTSLARRLHAESSLEAGYPTGYWLVREKNNGKTVTLDKGYAANIAEQLVAGDLIRALNRYIAHDGSWVVAWVGWGTKCIALWLDKDGDTQFTVEIEEDTTAIFQAGLDHWVYQCEDAWRQWHKAMRDVLDPSEDQTFKKALGQRAPSAGGPPNGGVPDFEI